MKNRYDKKAMSVIIVALLAFNMFNVLAAANIVPLAASVSTFTLSFQGFDYDNKGEITILVNNQLAATLPPSETPSNSGVFKSFSVDITSYVISGSNTLTFKESSGHSSGVKNVKVTGPDGVLLDDSTYYALYRSKTLSVTYKFSATISPPSTGTLSVTTTPIDGLVFVDGAAWGISPVSKSVAPGSHTVSFGPISEYITPSSVTVSVTAGQTTEVTGTYISSSPTGQYTLSFEGYDYDNEGEVSVLVNNQVIAALPTRYSSQNNNAFASYSLDISPYIVFGSNKLTFQQNFYSSGVQSVQITDSDGTIFSNSTYYYIQAGSPLPSVTYKFSTDTDPIPNTGMLSVTTTPVNGEVFVDGASWGEAPVSKTIPIGSYIVSYSSVAGYTSPSSVTVSITAGRTTSVTGTYTPSSSAGQHTLSFQGYDYDNKGEVSILVNNQLVTSLPTVESSQNNNLFKSFFADISNYVVEGDNTIVFKQNQYSSGVKDVKVTAGSSDVLLSDSTQHDLWAEGTSSVTYTFSTIYTPPPITGTLYVNTVPVSGEVFVNGVSWGTAPVSKVVPIGSYVVSFGEVPGYTAPSSVSATVTEGKTTSIVEDYTAASPPPNAYTLLFQGFDYDNKGEVTISVNNQAAASLPTVESSPNNNVFKSFSVDISKYVVSGENTIVFKQNLYSSGVKDVQVTAGSSMLLSDSAYHNIWTGGTRSSVIYKFNVGAPSELVTVSTFNINDDNQQVFNSTDVVRVGVKISGSISNVKSVLLSTTGPAGYVGLSNIPMNLQSTGSGDWLSGWSYRKSHMISAASSAGINYQIRIVVHRGSGSDTGSNAYLNYHSLNWPDDVRFTDADGVTELSHWLEGSDGDTAVFWVKVYDNLSYSSTNIYIYYGKLGVSSASNGQDTFIFFDDFNGALDTTNRWNVGGGTPTESGGVLTVDSPNESVYSKSNYGVNTALIYKGNHPAADNNRVGYVDAAGNAPFAIFHRNTGDFMMRSHVSTEERDYLNPSLLGVYHNYGIGRDGGVKNNFYVDNELKATHTSQVTPALLPLTIYSGSTAQLSVDWLALRSYVNPEPSQGGWGNEEKAAGLTTLYNYFYDYALPSPPPSGYYAVVSVEFNDGSTEVASNWFKSMRQMITDDGPWTLNTGSTAILSFDLASLGSESQDTRLFIDLSNSVSATSVTLDGEAYTLETGSGAPTGYTRYYVSGIYIDTGGTRTVVFTVKASSSATLGERRVWYFSAWKTYEGYQYTTLTTVDPKLWVPNTVPSGHYIRFQSIVTPYGPGWSVDTSSSSDYPYSFMGWAAGQTWRVPSDGKLTVSGIFLKFDLLATRSDGTDRSYVRVYILSSDGKTVLAAANVVYQADQIDVWYNREVTISGLTPGRDVSIGIGRDDSWIDDHRLFAKWTGVHVSINTNILTIQ